MKSSLSIRSWVQPFDSVEGVAVVFDIFRCSSTIHCLHSLRNGPVYVAPSLAEVQEEARVREMRVFSELSQPVKCLERYDNSPLQALTSTWGSGHSSLVATTTGTPAMFAAKRFEKVYVGSLVSFTSLIGALAKLQCPITLIPAAYHDSGHIEDEIACQAVATALEGFPNIPDFVRQCAEQAKEKILASPRPEILAGKISTGAEDVKIALELDKFSQVLALKFEAGEDPLFAEVIQEE